MFTQSKPAIGLTQFVDYTLKGSGGQLSEVRKIKYQDEYHPAFDYWKILREGIVKLHSDNLEIESLYSLGSSVDDKKKINYRDAIKAYAKFLKNKNIVWFNPPKATWIYNELTIRSSPELGLILNNQPYLIKLYFKEKSLTKRSVKDVLTLMAHSHYEDEFPLNTKFALLDVRKSKLVFFEDYQADDLLVLESHAHQFLYLWEKVSFKG